LHNKPKAAVLARAFMLMSPREEELAFKDNCTSVQCIFNWNKSCTFIKCVDYCCTAIAKVKVVLLFITVCPLLL
jgi:hypothetical protein